MRAPMSPLQSRSRSSSSSNGCVRQLSRLRTNRSNTALRQCVFAALISLAVAASPSSAEILAFDLLPVINSSHVGVLAVSLGPQDGGSGQQISLLAALYTNSDSMMEIPVASLCTADGSEQWNPISQPATGDVVEVGTKKNTEGDVLGSSRVVLVRWEPSFQSTDEVLGLTLRKGRGEQARNISVIDTNMVNDGEYPWDASFTFHDEKLKNGSDYSLLLWTKSQARQSASGYFTMQTNAHDSKMLDDKDPGSSNKTTKTSSRARQEKCQEYLASNGGFYNQSLDEDFRRGDSVMGALSDVDTGWEVVHAGAGSTTLSFEGHGNSRERSTLHFDDVAVDLISRSTLGRGMFSLGVLQASRNAEIAEMNVVALNLGTEGQPGSAVLGGYDSALVDPDRMAVFSKDTTLPYAFHAPMVGLSVQNGDVTTSVLDDSTNVDSAADVALVYDDPGIRLSQDLIDALLPLIGSPTFDSELDGYVYEGEAETNYTLTFSFSNGVDGMVAEIPGSSLVVTETANDNPLTVRNETGRTYLRISRTADGTSVGQYLGRSFLQHVYMIDSPSTIGKFIISALPSPLPDKKLLVAASPSSIKIFQGKGVSGGKHDSRPSVGAMVGGIVGGAVALLVGIVVCFFVVRRRQRRQNDSFISQRSMNVTDDSSYSKPDLDHIVHHHRGAAAGYSAKSPAHTATIPIHYDPSFAKDTSPAPYYSAHTLSPLPRQPPSAAAPSTLHSSSTSSSTRLSTTLSTIARRNSEVSTVAREYPAAAADPPLLYRSATVGRVYTAGKVKSVTPPLTPRGHARTASLGRIVTPTAVDVPASTTTTATSATTSSSLEDLREESSSTAEAPQIPFPRTARLKAATASSLSSSSSRGSAGEEVNFTHLRPESSESESGSGDGDGDGDDEVFGLSVVPGEYMTSR